MSEKITLDMEDIDGLLDIHQEAEKRWEAVWEIANECNHADAGKRAANLLAQHRWAIFVINEAKKEKSHE